jgi:hypothetical protein
MFKRSIATAVAICLTATAAWTLVGPASATPKAPARSGATAQAATTTLRNIPITGVTNNGTTFVGDFDVRWFLTRGGALYAVGRLSGTLTDAAGHVVGTIDQILVRFPIDVGGTCSILTLDLGPLDLDLLGLVVHLDAVHLTIDAESGPGNLLGNLLCAITGLLDRGVALDLVDNLLNALLGVLRL